MNEPDLHAKQIVVVDDGASEGSMPALAGLTWVEGAKPFIFARNANLGLRKAFETSDAAILCNDDAILTTPKGFTSLYGVSLAAPKYGVVASSCNNVGNENQLPKGSDLIRREPNFLCFVCVVIPRKVFQEVGDLDERYCLDYGTEDGDYCYRAKKAGYFLGVSDSCFVEHGVLKSTYREHGPRSFAHNAELFREKWGIDYVKAMSGG